MLATSQITVNQKINFNTMGYKLTIKFNKEVDEEYKKSQSATIEQSGQLILTSNFAGFEVSPCSKLVMYFEYVTTELNSNNTPT